MTFGPSSRFLPTSAFRLTPAAGLRAIGVAAALVASRGAASAVCVGDCGGDGRVAISGSHPRREHRPGRRAAQRLCGVSERAGAGDRRAVDPGGESRAAGCPPDSGAEQGFLPIAYLEVIDTSPDAGAADDDGCAIQPTRGGGDQGRGFLALGLLALVGLATRGDRARGARAGS